MIFFMNRLFSNAFWLMASQIGGLLIPLIELPLLARRLGADEYGKVVTEACSFKLLDEIWELYQKSDKIWSY